MKKIVALVAVLFSVVVPVQSQAADEKSVVVIDSYFDSKSKFANVSCVVLDNSVCTDVITSFGPKMTSPENHGNQVISAAVSQNPSAKIIALRSGTVVVNKKSPGKSYVNDMTAEQFLSALQWVDANKSLVGAVSFSRFFGNSSTCSASNKKTDASIKSIIASLKSQNILIFAAAGNHNNAIDFPACIPDVVSVGAAGGVNGNFQATTADIVVSATSYRLSPTQNIVQSTSAATAVIASRYKLINIATTKVVSIP